MYEIHQSVCQRIHNMQPSESYLLPQTKGAGEVKDHCGGIPLQSPLLLHHLRR